MTIRTLEQVPLRSQPATFAEDMEGFLSDLPGWTIEVNATATEVATLAAQTNLDAISLAENTPTVLAVANFKGPWTSLSGALNKPATVYHLGAYWALSTNVANVATTVPGISPLWLSLATSDHIYNVTHGVI